MRLGVLVTAVLTLLATAAPAGAQRGGHGGFHSGGRSSSGYKSRSGSDGSVHVRGYTRKDGSYVAPHDRRAPGEGQYKSPASPRTSAPKLASPGRTTAPRATAPTSGSRTKRSEAAKDQFMRQSGHPHGWPGHVVDHRVPLACGGADAPSNMQWQTTEEAKAKDRVERQGCRRP